jgi:hypothetical protein
MYNFVVGRKRLMSRVETEDAQLFLASSRAQIAIAGIFSSFMFQEVINENAASVIATGARDFVYKLHSLTS